MIPSPKDPLHGVTLEALLTELVAHYGWDGLAERVAVRCFKNDPSIKSSLTFLRRTLWAREKVEVLFVRLQKKRAKEPQAAKRGRHSAAGKRQSSPG